MQRSLLVALAIALLPSAAVALQTTLGNGGPPAPEPSTATVGSAVLARQAPVLDGRTDDPVWQDAIVIDQFLEYEPNQGAETRFKTEARVAYDDRNLYVLVRMFDPAPDSIVSLLARRDERVPSEQLKLVIDSYHDGRTAYQFAVNPAGVKRDFYVYNDNVEDPSWDAVWDVATAIDSLGWVAEFRIPFSQMRFNEQPEHTFGLMIVRDVARTGARISWPLYRRDRQGYVSQAGDLTGISGLSSPRRLEVVPYVVTKNVTVARDAGFGRAQEQTAGADVKYGLSSNLTLDATINPDFGQVEADPAVLNLSAFEQFFQERRPFFLEGTGIFAYPVQCNDVDASSCTGMFYSRRIGRAPQLAQFGDDRSPTSTSILGAAKVSGRLGNGLSVGLLNAVTNEQMGLEERAIEPRTNYFVARARQELGGGRADLGAMATSVNRQLDPTAEPLLRREAYAGGLDLRYRLFENNYEVSASLTGSVVRGSPDAIARTQQDGVHRYQRPDDDLRYDPTRTSLIGDAQRVSFSKFGGGITRFQTVYQRFSPGFEINDVGFLSRADEQLFRNWFSINLIEPTSMYRRAFLNFNHYNTWTSAGLPTALGFNVNWHVELPTFWWLHVGSNVNNPVGAQYDDRVARGGPALRHTPSANGWVGFESDGRKTLRGSLFAGTGRTDAGQSRDWFLEPQIGYRLASRVSGSLAGRWSNVVNDNQWRANFGDVLSDTAHFTFARLDQTTVSLTSRLNFTATPNLSLQIYAQPFWSTGSYSDWRELDDPRASDYAGRYRPYSAGGDPGGFNVMQFRSNTVVRWEYRPGSTMFLVWAQGRQQSGSAASSFDFGRDSRELFSLHPDNTLLLKVSYWFNP